MKNLVLLIVLGVVIAAAAITVLLMWPQKGPDGDKQPSKMETVIEYVKRSVYSMVEQKDLGNPNDDIGKMMIDCDNTELFTTAVNIALEKRSGKYVQGTGSFGRLSPKLSIYGIFDKEVDISEYKKGSIHLSVYVNNPSKMKGEIWFELSSSGKSDKDEIAWLIPPSVIKKGWNEYYLSIPEAHITGNPDLTKINYFRSYTKKAGYGVDVLFDNIYVTSKAGTSYKADLPPIEPDKYKETTTKNGKMIMSCNTVNILEGISNAKVTTKKGTFLEGTGAFELDCKTGAAAFNLKKSTDISAYQEGYIHLSLYISDVSKITKRVMMEFTSSGTYDKDEFTYQIALTDLKSGWNQLWLPLATPTAKVGNPNWAKIDFIRIWADKSQNGLVAYLDDVYATMEGETDEYAETTTNKGKMIASCNTINIFKIVKGAKVTTKEGEFLEGTGAMKSTATGEVIFEGVLKNPVDVSAYEKGYLHYSIYLDKPEKCGKELIFELTSSGTKDKDEYSFIVKTNTLQKGWNDIYVPVSKTMKKGSPDLAKINYIRIYHTNFNDKKIGLTAILDDVCMTLKQFDSYSETEATTGNKMIASCNTKNIFTKLENVTVTTTSREYVEGTGAFKKDYGKTLLAIMEKPVDISAYKDGYVHVSLYISDVSLLSEKVTFEVASEETPDQGEYNWQIQKESLRNGWNEVYLKLDNQYKSGIDPDLTAMKRIRMYSRNEKKGLVTIVDNIYATMSTTSDNACECGRPVYEGDILLGNCMCNFKKAFNMKLVADCVEGDRALEAKNPAAGMFATFKNAVNLSAYKEGTVHLQVYVDDVKLLKNNLVFELTSSGTYDKDEYKWEIKKGSLENGWNEISLPISKASVTGKPNLSAINYFRLYTAQANEQMILRLDNVYATEK